MWHKMSVKLWHKLITVVIYTLFFPPSTHTVYPCSFQLSDIAMMSQHRKTGYYLLCYCAHTGTILTTLNLVTKEYNWVKTCSRKKLNRGYCDNYHTAKYGNSITKMMFNCNNYSECLYKVHRVQNQNLDICG